jgi:hypothetical protein
VDLKCKQWHAWFDKPIPMLQHMTPPEAAQTERGRRLLDDLLCFYDQNRHMDSYPGYIDANVPSKWAKWKLGYGPGSASEFAEEEAIFNSVDPRLATRRIHRKRNVSVCWRSKELCRCCTRYSQRELVRD